MLLREVLKFFNGKLGSFLTVRVFGKILILERGFWFFRLLGLVFVGGEVMLSCIWLQF